MGIVINTLLPSLNAQGQINKNERSYKKSIAKLASGYKINKSADDASGLAVSEKMRNKITALDTDSMNCEDGINLLQTADGAMEEINEILQRCTMLAGKAANGTLGKEERRIIRNEIDELHEEIFRIKDSVKFNERKILKTEGDKISINGSLPSWASADTESLSGSVLGGKYNDGSDDYVAAVIDISSFSPEDIPDSVGKGFYTTCCTCDNFYSVKFTDSDQSTMKTSGNNYIFEVSLKGVKTPKELYERIKLETANLGTHYSEIKYDDGKMYIHDNRKGVKPDPDNNRGLFGGGVAYESSEVIEDLSFKIGDTSTKADKLDIKLPDISARKLGLSNIDVINPDNAMKAIEVYKNAGKVITDARGKIGAYQNRLEHTINTLTQASENTTESRSRIMDTDMAKESTELARFSILSQSSQAMLAQANSQPEGILSLIQQQ